MVDKPQDESIKDKIIELLGKGYNRSQLIKDFKFAQRTVDNAIKKYKEEHGDDRGEGKEVTGTPGRDGALAIRKDKESVLPEWLERDVAEIFDGQIRDQRIFLAGMSVPLMGLRLFAEGVKPIIDLMATWQKGQAEAAQAAQQSGIEIAQTAGEAAAGGVAKFFMETKPWQAASPNPMQSMIVDTMRPIFQQMIGQVMGGFMRPTTGTQAGQAGPQQMFQQNPSQGATPVSASGAEQVSQEEIEEVFGDE